MCGCAIRERRWKFQSSNIESSWCTENYRLPEIGLVVNEARGILHVNEDRVELNLDDEKPITWYKQDLDDFVSFVLGATEYVREDDFFIRAVADGGLGNPDFSSSSRVNDIISEARSLAVLDG